MAAPIKPPHNTLDKSLSIIPMLLLFVDECTYFYIKQHILLKIFKYLYRYLVVPEYKIY